MQTIRQTIVHNDESIQALARITTTLRPIKVRKITMAILAVMLIFCAGYYFNISKLPLAIFCLLVGAGSLFYVVFYYNKQIIKTTIKQALSVKGRGITYTISESTIKVNNNQSYSWDQVRSVIETEGYICIVLKNSRTLVLDEKRLTKQQIQWLINKK